MIKATLQPMTLVLWEAKSMDKRIKDEKGVWQKTGEKEEFTVYTFRDEFGEVLKFMVKGADMRHLEGSEVIVTLELSYDDYNNKNVMKISHVEQVAS